MDFINLSIEWFKHYALQARNKFAHEGTRLNFFERLAIETLDSVITLAMVRIMNKGVSTREDMKRVKAEFAEWIFSQDFEKFKKVI